MTKSIITKFFLPLRYVWILKDFGGESFEGVNLYIDI